MSLRLLLLGAFSAAMATTAAVPALAAPRGFTVEDMVAMERVGHPVLSPDATRVVYTVRTTNLDDAMEELDILYMTRVQRERFFNEEDYIRMKDCYILDQEKMKLAKPDMFVLHPLPRVNEISVEVDDDPRAAYFRQVQYGVYVRMALIMTLLEVEKPC